VQKGAIGLKTRIWFNHWFNSAYHFIHLIRENPDGMAFEFYGTNENTRSSVLQACDVAEQEPALDPDTYVEYCLGFCKKYKIDLFIPRRGMQKIAENRALFEGQGTRILCEPDTALLRTVEKKSLFYTACAENGILELPEYAIADTPDGFLAAYEKLTAKGLVPCFKPVDGEGGSGFRVIRENANELSWLLNPVTHRVSIEQVMAILQKHDRFPPLMVLEYLDGEEYSVDCLAQNQKLLCAVQRKKVDARQRALVFSEEIDDLCKRIFGAFPLSYVSNIQIKYGGGRPKILEINPRMSGGLHISCHSGVNFPYLAVRLALGLEATPPQPLLNRTFTQIEKEIELCR
jgi:carbamoylphosphate synthase large subunit